MMIAATLEPQSVTASANPRPVTNRLVTAAVHTEGWIRTIPKATGSHSARHIHRLGPVKPSIAVAAQMEMTAAIPSRRGPNLSTSSPVNGAHITPAIDAIA
nr:hypothetical protein [Novosphingobium sp. G106]